MVVLLFVLLTNVSLGLFVFLRNPKGRVNQLFLALALSISLWTLSSYLTDYAPAQYRLISAKFAFIFPVVVSGSIAYMSRIFPVDLRTRAKYTYYLVSLVFIGIGISMTSLVVGGIKLREDGTNVLPGAGYTLYVVVVLLLFLYGVRGYLQARRVANPQQKVQSKFIAYGFLFSFLWALFCNALAPALFPSLGGLAKYGPSGTVILVAMTAYAIVKHRLFDIRLVVARSLGYILSIAALSLTYGFLAFNVINHFIFNGADIDVFQRAFYTVLAVIIAFTFQPLRRFFDKWTSRIFYRDAYDPQQFLNELNTVLVSTIELEPLLKRVSAVVEDSLKPVFCVFGLKASESVGERIIGVQQLGFKTEDIRAVRTVTPTINQKVIFVDELEDHLHDARRVLQRNNISVLVRLVDDVSVVKEGIGYIALGPKKSGNLYNRQDAQMLEIISDELVIAIQNALRFEEIEQFNITLQEKIDNATRQLKRANDKLVALNDTKDDFISMASHQLRTPLTAVKGNISMIMDGDFGKVPNTVKDPLGQAYASSERMVGLIADLLNVSRLRTGKFAIQPVPSNLDTVVKSELKQLQETAKAHKLKLVYHEPKSFPTLMLDEIKVRQVIMNFIDNAIYYTPAGGQIDVTLKHTSQAIEFTVVDNGIGVPRHLQRNLFTKFYRADNAQKMRPDGTGIGLFMAKKVIVASGGSTIFKSVENQGSTFGFTIPLAKVPKPSEPNQAATA